MPLGAKSTSKGIWNGVLEKCGKRLTNWKSQYLSWGGRLTLINSVINALPSYMMSIFPMPSNVSKSIDALRRNFLWQGSEDKKKFHLVKWEELIVSKNPRGQGWNLFLRGNLHDREMDKVADFQDSVGLSNLTEKDLPIWKNDTKEQIWRMFICLKGIRWVKPLSIKGVLSSWNKDGNSADKEKRWKLVPSCI
ncbi:hypothetical protein H5410_026238 [Solanum commersonii]|uniref:Uncharacterized protein n=1 Tax=Solanum commersonii TaxID=4109 RepID=A0A9J5YWG6_SOLCO|nr:hypothetical protein H5410_026238 [Solanum commersonii]